MENSKNILIINDMPGYGKVALAAMLPILSNMAIVSTTCPPPWCPILWTTGNLPY